MNSLFSSIDMFALVNLLYFEEFVMLFFRAKFMCNYHILINVPCGRGVLNVVPYLSW